MEIWVVKVVEIVVVVVDDDDDDVFVPTKCTSLFGQMICPNILECRGYRS